MPGMCDAQDHSCIINPLQLVGNSLTGCHWLTDLNVARVTDAVYKNAGNAYLNSAGLI